MTSSTQFFEKQYFENRILYKRTDQQLNLLINTDSNGGEWNHQQRAMGSVGYQEACLTEFWFLWEDEKENHAQQRSGKTEQTEEETSGRTQTIDPEVPYRMIHILCLCILFFIPSLKKALEFIASDSKMKRGGGMLWLLRIESNVSPEEVENGSSDEWKLNEKGIEKWSSIQNEVAQQNVTATRNVARQLPKTVPVTYYYWLFL